LHVAVNVTLLNEYDDGGGLA